MERVTVWKDDEGYHMVKGSDATKELVYPKHLAKAFYLEVVKEAVESKEEE
jgi:hypothetical protein